MCIAGRLVNAKCKRSRADTIRCVITVRQINRDVCFDFFLFFCYLRVQNDHQLSLLLVSEKGERRRLFGWAKLIPVDETQGY